MPKVAILKALAEDEYCCPYGFFKLCRLRGEKQKEMVASYNLKLATIKAGFAKVKSGEFACRKYSNCLGVEVPELHEMKDKAPKPSPAPKAV